MTDGLFVMNFLKTVSTGPSSRSFPHVDKSLDEITIMNSAEEISKYNDNNSHYRSPTLARRAGAEQNEPKSDKPKKDRKWSLGGFFRRRKKEVENESTSEEETPTKRGFLQRRKQKKEDKRKKLANKSLGHFDHIVVTPAHLGKNCVNNGNNVESSEVFSDPTFGYPSYWTASFRKYRGSTDRISSKESLNKSKQELNLSRGSLASTSQDSTGRKSRKGKVKARVEAIRAMKNDSSSDEGSQRSTASSITRFKSDESLTKKDGTSNRKTRSARTERYNRRLTKEDENVLNREAEIGKHKSNKLDTGIHQTKVQANRWNVVDEMPSSAPIKPYIKPTLNYTSSVPLHDKSYSGISTIPPSHSMIHRTISNLSDGPKNYFNLNNSPNSKNSVRNQIDSLRNIPRINLHNQEKRDFKPEQRSFSYDCNINRSPTPGKEEQILHIHFPIGKPVPKQRNPTLINSVQNYSPNYQKSTPPPPPPRDPQRRLIGNVQYENTRPMSYAFENGNQSRHIPIQQSSVDRSSSVRSFNVPSTRQSNIDRTHSFGWQPNYRSSSENYIAQSNQIYNNPHIINRPASTSPDALQQRFIRRHPTTEQYKYFAEKTPRSRKPIHITATPTADQPYLSDSQVVTKSYSVTKHPVHAASEFWKQKDKEELKRKSQLLETTHKEKIQKPAVIHKKPEEVKKKITVLSMPVKTADSLSSPSGVSDLSPLCTKPSFEQTFDSSPRPLSMVIENAETQQKYESFKNKKEPPEPPARRCSRQSSASSVEHNWANNPEETEKTKRRSSNLEDALDELEAIYKSLRLGDEDLLDRAEQRDISSAVTEKLLTEMPDSHANWGTPGTQSDSSFNYDFDRVDGFRKKRSFRKSCVPDKLNDDMAYRRLNKDRPPPLDVNVAISQVSYLLASPVLGAPAVDENYNESIITNNEPDITLDDVVYRNIKHTNNTLKVADPQPPFGIPVGPITSATNSDYLHAVPENRPRPRFAPQKSPDVVKDDLAYRTLRKDSSGLAADDYINNNNTDYSSKKRKAVRSISANIYNMMHRDALRAAESENEFDKAQSLTDIADAMEVARQILKDRQNKIHRKSTSSDTELKPFNSNHNAVTSTGTVIENKVGNINLPKEEKLQINLSLSGNEEISNQKPPICPTPDRKSSKPPTKESTPITVSPSPEENHLDNNHLEDLLTALAKEARETSEKLGHDLKLLDEEESRKCSPRLSQSTTPIKERAKSPVIMKTLDEKLSDIDAVSEHAKLCEKLLGAVVESTKLISHSIAASNEPHLEEVNDMPTDPIIYKSVANVIVTRNADAPISDTKSELCSESEHDYENIHDTEEESEEETCTSPFVENKTKLVAEFEELKKDLFSDNVKLEIQGIQDDDTDDDMEENLQSATLVPSEDDATFDKLQDNSCSEEGEVCSAVCLASNSLSTDYDLINEICITPPESFITSTEFDTNYNDLIQNFIPSMCRIRDVSEHSSGFHTDSHGSSADSSLNFNTVQNLTEVDTEMTRHEEIKPQTKTELKLSPIMHDNSNGNPSLKKPSTSLDNCSTSSCVPSDSKTLTPALCHSEDKSNLDSHPVAWYRDPTTLALACSYSLAFVHQFAIVDLVTLLGLLLAIVTVVAAFVL